MGLGLKGRLRVSITLEGKRTNRVKDKLNDFRAKVKKAIISLSDTVKLTPLTEDELRNLGEQHFNGFSGNKVATPFFKPEFKIGKKFFSVFGLDNDDNQKDGDIDVAVLNPSMSSEISNMYSSYMAGFGHELGFEHTVNSFIFYDNQQSIKKELESNRSKLSGIRFLGRENMENAKRIEEFLSWWKKKMSRL